VFSHVVKVEVVRFIGVYPEIARLVGSSDWTELDSVERAFRTKYDVNNVQIGTPVHVFVEK